MYELIHEYENKVDELNKLLKTNLNPHEKEIILTLSIAYKDFIISVQKWFLTQGN